MEVWCSLLREARDRFELGALKLDIGPDGPGAPWRNWPPATRGWRPTTTAALNAIDPPGVDGDDWPEHGRVCP